MERVKFLRVERRARRMHAVMARLEVDPGWLVRPRGGDAYAEARARCLFRGTNDKCLRWLDRRRSQAARPGFCPNLSLFEACIQHHARQGRTTRTEPESVDQANLARCCAGHHADIG
jgi:hypothetical protein